MVALATSAIVHLAWAFTPLAAIWAAREAAVRGGGAPGVLMWLVQGGTLALLLVLYLATAVALAVWWHRAADRRRPAGRLEWSWWGIWLAGLGLLTAGSVLTWPAELRSALGEVTAGATVPLGRVDQLLGYQIAARLPGAVLVVAAAVLGMVAVHRVTVGRPAGPVLI